MSAWGGHSNGRIPTSALTYVGIGVRSGEPQYLHPTVAAAWKALQADFKRHKVDLLITEGYRTLELQQAYWNRYQAGGTVAARPGTSKHGWATAVDMANYLALPPSVRRPLIEARGFSLETGDRIREPWHIEYVGTLTQAGTPGTPITTEEEDEMRIIQPFGGDGRAAIAPGFGYIFPTWDDYVLFCNVYGIDPNAPTQKIGDASVSKETAQRWFNQVVDMHRAGSAPTASGGTVNLAPVLAAIDKVPIATVDELRDRL